MATPVRYSTQLQQEQISRHQLCERLAEFGWVPTSPLDLGEDFIVHIYHEGKATGVTFHIQLKSVTNLYERRRDGYLPYDLEVKDLKHWQEFSLPVVLMVWDIHLREGRWVLIERAISQLDQRLPDWQNNKSKVCVHIPWRNTTDDAGLLSLRRSIGESLYPVIAKGKRPEASMHFPSTEEGREGKAALSLLLRENAQISLPGKYLHVSEWWTRWFGQPFEERDVLLIPSPLSPYYVRPFRMEFVSSSGERASFPNVKLSIIRGNLDEALISNQRQLSPLRFDFTIGSTSSVVIRSSWHGAHVQEAREAAQFLMVVATGGVLQATPLGEDEPWLEFTYLPQPENTPRAEWVQLLDELSLIQEKTGQTFQLPVGDRFSAADVRATHRLAKIVECGQVVARYRTASGEFDKPSLEVILQAQRQSRPFHLRKSFPESSVRLLGLAIQTGRQVQYISGVTRIAVTELEQLMTEIPADGKAKLELAGVEIIDIFPDWFIREAERLGQILARDLQVEAIYLFGSLAWNGAFNPKTDIDLAVRGLPKERLYEALGVLERETKFPGQLFDFEDLPEHLRQRILSEGKVLAGQQSVPATDR